MASHRVKQNTDKIVFNGDSSESDEDEDEKKALIVAKVEAEMRASAEAAAIAKKTRLEEIIQGAKKVTVIGLDGKRMTHYVKKGDVEQNVQETVKAKTGIPVEEPYNQ